MTKFTDTTGKKTKTKETVFTHQFDVGKGWIDAELEPSDFKEVKYLGHCKIDGDMFACYNIDGIIDILKGFKGDEF